MTYDEYTLMGSWALWSWEVLDKSRNISISRVMFATWFLDYLETLFYGISSCLYDHGFSCCCSTDDTRDLFRNPTVGRSEEVRPAPSMGLVADGNVLKSCHPQRQQAVFFVCYFFLVGCCTETQKDCKADFAYLMPDTANLIFIVFIPQCIS